MSGELPTTELKSQILEKVPTASLGQVNSPSNTQAKLQAALWMLCNILIKVSEVLSKARTESNLASIKAGFSSADETGKAGLFQLGGGAILAGTGVAQGVAGCKSATELAEVKQWREGKVAEINKNTMSPKEEASIESVKPPTEEIESSDITVQVEAIGDEPILEEIEEETFYEVQEEVQSCKQTEPEEQTKEAQMVKKENTQGKMTGKEGYRSIRQVDREYEINKDAIQAKAGKIQGLAVPGQGLYHASQGLGDIERSKAQKNTIDQQTKENAQAQQEKTTDGLNKEIDRLKDFNAFRSNSSSLKG
jgi:hypothetical protein